MDIPAGNQPFLGFHQVGDTFDWTLNVYPPARLITILNHLAELENKPALFFDDGYADVGGFVAHNARLFQPFNRYVSIISGAVGGSNRWDYRPGAGRFRHLNETEIRTLFSEGWHVVSHGLSHRSLVSISNSRLLSELADSKRALEDITGSEITGLSFPFGFYSNRVVETAISCGYRQFFSIRKENHQVGPVQRVLAVYRWDGLPSVQRKLTNHSMELLKLRMINNCASGTVLMQLIADLLKR